MLPNYNHCPHYYNIHIVPTLFAILVREYTPLSLVFLQNWDAPFPKCDRLAPLEVTAERSHLIHYPPKCDRT
jgi:hypothetical protein